MMACMLELYPACTISTMDMITKLSSAYENADSIPSRILRFFLFAALSLMIRSIITALASFDNSVSGFLICGPQGNPTFQLFKIL